MKKWLTICFTGIFLCGPVHAVEIPTGQDIGSTLKGYTEEKRQKKVIKRLSTPKVLPPALSELEITTLPVNVESVYIRKIVVQHDIFIEDSVEEQELRRLIKDYENSLLSIEDMKKVATFVTQTFANEGLKAYVPKQSFDYGVMYINLISEK